MAILLKPSAVRSAVTCRLVKTPATWAIAAVEVSVNWLLLLMLAIRDEVLRLIADWICASVEVAGVGKSVGAKAIGVATPSIVIDSVTGFDMSTVPATAAPVIVAGAVSLMRLARLLEAATLT